MAVLDVSLDFLSKAKMRLTKIRAGLMALWRNIKEPIRACKLRLEMDFLRKVFAHKWRTSNSLDGGIWIVPKEILMPIPKHTGLEVGGTDFEELKWKPSVVKRWIVNLN
jgi:hypothetical protein